ncbi:MAG: hypothetical protein FWB90_05590 [Fibromonadales bacterium]|nr:hypothetical protein [Fibromonadales bacterium]
MSKIKLVLLAAGFLLCFGCSSSKKEAEKDELSIIYHPVEHQIIEEVHHPVEPQKVEDYHIELQKLCNKEYMLESFCGFGSHEADSENTALHVAVLSARMELGTQVAVEVETEAGVTTFKANAVEKVVGVRSLLKSFEDQRNIMENPELCSVKDIVANIGGKATDIEVMNVHRDEKFVEYYILSGSAKSIVGTCSINRNGSENTVMYIFKVGEGASYVRTRKTYVKYDEEKKKYTAYVLVTLPH